MEIYVKYLLFPHFLFFSGFQTRFFRCVDFTHIAASNRAGDHVTNKVPHRIFNTDLYSCAHFVFEIGEKYSHDDGF